MSNKVANTFFEAGPKDDLLTVDVYELTDNSPKNNLLDKVNNIALGVIDNIRNDPNTLNNIKSVLTSEASENLTQEEVVNALIDNVGELRGPLKDVSGPLLELLTTNYNEEDFSKNDVLIMMAEGVKEYSGEGSKDLNSFMGLLEAKTGGSSTIEIVDLTIETIITSSLFSNALELGLPSVARDILETVKDPLIAVLTIRKTLKDILKQGDIDSLTLALEQLGGGRLKAEDPNIINNFLRNYRHPKKLKRNEYQSHIEKILNVFNKIDPHWNTVLRGNERISSLTPFMSASKDAIELFSTDSRFSLQTTVSQGYRPINQKVIVKGLYPKIGIK